MSQVQPLRQDFVTLDSVEADNPKLSLAAVMDTLRLMAVEEGVAIGKPNIIDFHKEVLRSLEKYGRAHKLGIMLGYKRQTGGWLKDLDLGLKMLAKRKLDLIPSRVRDANKEIADLFTCYWRESA
jgi:heterodisulfide reductase subunit C2